MRPIFLTVPEGRSPQLKDEILGQFNDGLKFKIWQGPECTVHDVPRMKAAGWTHIFLVWQTRNLQVHHHIIDLATFRGPAPLKEG